MRVLRIELFQETVCYKKPFAFKVAETYPLPPYSTVKGMLHYLLEAKEFIPMAISIQGDYESIFNNYQSMYLYKKKSITQMPLNVHLLYNVHLIIHINAKTDILEKIKNRIENLNEFLSLGRKEDLVRVDKVQFVEIKSKVIGRRLSEPIQITMPIYIPKNKKPDGISGINYKLNWKYEINNKIRKWEKIDVVYVDTGEIINNGQVLVDEFGQLVFFNISDEIKEV